MAFPINRMTAGSWLLLLVSLLSNPAVVAEDEYYQNSFQVCGNSPIVVSEISLLCDSAGTYYYGSGRYRDSASCQATDKAKLQVDFEIEDYLENNAAYLTLQVEASNSGGVSTEVLYQTYDLCSLETLTSIYGDACPAPGWYRITEQFYWGDASDGSSKVDFVPTVVVGFKSDKNEDKYDLGGANTDLCEGDTFTDWTEGVKKSSSEAFLSFLVSFSILFGTIGALFCVGYYLYKRPGEKFCFPESRGDDDTMEEDDRKLGLMGNNRNLIDF